MTLGEKIYRLRTDRNMTQEQLAERLGVTRQSISKWEGDLVKPEIEKLKAMAKLFEVSLDDLISDEASDDKDKEKTMAESSLNKKEKLNRIIITVIACLLIIAMTVTIVVMINLSKRVRYLELHRDVYIGEEEKSDEDIYFSELEWKVADVDKENMTADIYITAQPKNYSDNTKLTAVAAFRDGKTCTGRLKNDNGRFTGNVSVPINAEFIKMSINIDNDGEKQMVSLPDEISLLSELVWLPDIEVCEQTVKGYNYCGIIKLLQPSCFSYEAGSKAPQDAEDIKLFIKIGDNTVFSDDVSRNDEGNIKEISYEIRKKALLEDGSQAPMLYLQYRSKALDRIIEISGEISAGSECRLYYETPGGYDDELEHIYNDNYHITIK